MLLAAAHLALTLTLSAGAPAWPSLDVPPPPQGGGENDAAVVVGIEKYGSVPSVEGAAENATDWYLWLTKTRGVPTGNAFLLRNNEGTLEKIRKFAAKAAHTVKPGGTLWFIFIGHGAPAADGKDGVLVGFDAQQDPDSLYARSLPQKELLSILGRSHASHTLVALDACFSGRTPTGAALAPGLQPLIPVAITLSHVNATVLTAGKADQFAGPLPGANRPAFSYLLLGALRGWADANHDTRVTVEEAIEFARQTLAALVRDRDQTPELVGARDPEPLSRGTEGGPDFAALVAGKSSDESNAPNTPAALTTSASSTDGFHEADRLMSDGDFEAAAKKYIAFVDDVQGQAKAGHRYAIKDAQYADKALNNAAVCLEQAHRFDSALQIYGRLFTDYPKSTLADAALFRVAVQAQQSYDFDRAVELYEKLINDYPTSKNRPAALANEAELLEGEQRYKDAARAFSRYAQTFSDQIDAPNFQYHAAIIYDRMNDPKGEIAALQEFQRKFAKSSKQAELVIEAYKRIADAYTKLGNAKAAKQSFESCVTEYKKRGMKPENAMASNAAAEAAFQLAEYDLATFDKLEIEGSGKALEKSFQLKKAAMKVAADAYDLVEPYQSREWTLAAFYRKGFMLERFANATVEAPVPAEVKQLGGEASASYQDMLGQQAAQLDDAAVNAYMAVLGEAKNERVFSDTWIQKTLESLNRYRPKEFPLLKAPKERLVLDRHASFSSRSVNAAAGTGFGLRNPLARGDLFEAAISEARGALTKDNRDTNAMLRLAIVYLEQGKDELALMVLNNAKAIKPDDSGISNALGIAHSGLKENALEDFKAAAADSPSLPEAHNNLGVLLNEAQDYAGAIKELEVAVRDAPDFAAAHLNLGNAFRGNQQCDLALQEYQKVLGLEPTSTDTLFNLAVLYFDGDFAGMTVIDRLQLADAYFDRFRSVGGEDERIEQYKKDVARLIAKEQRRLERKQKQTPPEAQQR